MKPRFKVGDRIKGKVEGKIVCVHNNGKDITYCVRRNDGETGGGCNGTWIIYESDRIVLDIKYKRTGRVPLSIY